MEEEADPEPEGSRVGGVDDDETIWAQDPADLLERQTRRVVEVLDDREQGDQVEAVVLEGEPQTGALEIHVVDLYAVRIPPSA